MNLNLILDKKAANFLYDLPAKQFRQIVIKCFSLMTNPLPNDCKSLQSDFKRVDIGEYRIVYKYNDECINIYLIGKRNDDEVYRKLRNLV